jgi:hypothetical protein
MSLNSDKTCGQCSLFVGRPIPQLHMNVSTIEHNDHLHKRITMLKKNFLLVNISHGCQQLYNIVFAF